MLRRRLLTVGAITAGILAWGVIAVFGLELAWPYPLILPETTTFHGVPYYQVGDCHSPSWFDHQGGSRVFERTHPIGIIRSALWVGAPTVYGAWQHSLNGYVFVQKPGCYQMYETDIGG